MHDVLAAGVALALLSGVMNGLFTTPMRFLGRWSWENVWAVFIFGSCILLPAIVVTFTAPQSWSLLANAPVRPLVIASFTGLAWGLGSVMFGQSVSAIGIALSNTFVLAISSALGSLFPLLLLSPQKIHDRSGHLILLGIAVEIIGISLCGRAGVLRERSGASSQRGELVGKQRPFAVALLLAVGAGLLSAIFNIGFALSQPIALYGRQAGLDSFQATNLIWVVMLAAGAVSNLVFCIFLFWRENSARKFTQPGSARLYLLGSLMAALWGGSIFVYGAATVRLGSLGPSIGWPLSLATGLLIANLIGLILGEWKGVSRRALAWMGPGIVTLVVAILILSRAN